MKASSPNEIFFAYLAVLSVQVVFCGYQLLTKVSLKGDLDPIGFALVRSVGTLLVFLGIAVCSLRKQEMIPRLVDLYRFALLGIFMTFNVLGVIFALKYTTSAIVAILQVLRPMFAGLISWAFGLEDFTVRKLIGACVCLLGTSVITLYGYARSNTPNSDQGSPLVGLFFVSMHSMGQALYVILQPPLLEKGYSPMVVNGYAYAITCALLTMMLPMPVHRGKWYETTTLFYVTAFWAIALVGVYSYVAMGWAAKRVGGTAVMLFMLVQAILTVLAGHLLLGEQIYASQLLGGTLILAGLGVYVSIPQQPKNMDADVAVGMKSWVGWKKISEYIDGGKDEKSGEELSSMPVGKV